MIIPFEFLKERIDRRVSIVKIAKEFGCNPKTVVKYCKKYNLIPQANFHDLTNILFGSLLVVDIAEKKIYSNGKCPCYYWNCKCLKCNKFVIYSSLDLKHRKYEACYECRNNEKFHSSKNIGYKDITAGMWKNIIKSAKTRNLKCSISPQYIWNLYEKQNKKCALTGTPIEISPFGKKKFQTASLDRIDNKKGYIEGNVRWLHKDVNMLKQKWSDDHLIYWSKKIAEYNK